jgi:hypothetical protein
VTIRVYQAGEFAALEGPLVIYQAGLYAALEGPLVVYQAGVLVAAELDITRPVYEADAFVVGMDL